MSKPLVLIGGGGHAKVLLDMITVNKNVLLGYVDMQATDLDCKYLGDDSVIFAKNPEEIALVNGVGGSENTAKRAHIFKHFKQKGYKFESVVHPSAVVAASVYLAEGTQVMAGAVVQPGCYIGANAIINTKASVDHDGKIGPHVHIAPGCTLSGSVTVGEGSYLGTGTTVIQKIKIGNDVFVAAGAVVVSDLSDNAFAMGVPAKEKKER